MNDCCCNGCRNDSCGGIFSGSLIWIIIAVIVVIWIFGDNNNNCCGC